MMNVRCAEMADLARIADIFSRSVRTLTFLPELHSVEEDYAYWRDHVMVEQRVFVAERDGAILGVMALQDGWINMLYADPDHCGTGAGSALVARAQQLEERIDLWCFQQNAGARRFYERHGFVAMAFTDGSGNDEKCPDVRYVWMGARTG